MTVPFTPLGDRVVIKADVEDHAPEVTEGGVVLAKTLAAAVEGSDVEDSWFVGTVVAIGPLVNHFDVRAYVLRRLRVIVTDAGGDDDSYADVRASDVTAVCANIEALPRDCPDPIKVGDRCTFSWASGQQITVDGDRFLIMRASDVLAVFEDELKESANA